MGEVVHIDIPTELVRPGPGRGMICPLGEGRELGNGALLGSSVSSLGPGLCMGRNSASDSILGI